MQITHKKLGINAELNDFSQKQYETYHGELMPYQGASAAQTNGAVVRAAIKAGFLIGIPAELIGDMKPSAVIWLTKQIHNHVKEVTTPPPDDPN